MRLLLLIALALLPLSAALKCYEGTDNVEDSAGSVPKVSNSCPTTSDVCTWMKTPDLVIYRCGILEDGVKAECKSDTKLYGSSTIPRDICTCKSDNCNESKAKAEESIKSPTATTGTATVVPTTPSSPPPATSSSTAFACYTGQVANATDPKNVPPPGEKNATACEDGINSCWWELHEGPSGQMLERRCGMKDGCVEGLKGCSKTKLEEGSEELTRTVCCCEDALCNGPDTPMTPPKDVVAPPSDATTEPTKGAAAASMFLAAAVAAIVAARCY
ncbi:hypothetical protein PRIPAC_90102 [Pristionchus pacificus]|uniref:Uncharacterized protein n=1 Tax=Pristionchus pacificus TaxID=54126 RepID=A0A2A6B949_PRIPA|nr:hypothetical protein PRIPAC_90102 [Pristionchus pacificus]|eukprot:PDM62396.1 hypothetical protein PRIPAC_51838 [Pristionchus pacificus]